MAEVVVKRAVDPSGDSFKTFADPSGRLSQAVVQVDSVTGAASPAGATEETLTSIDSKIVGSTFARLLEKRFLDGEEVRYDIPAVLASASLYLGAAADGTATDAAGWAVVRFYFGAGGTPERARIRLAIAWDDRASGWT